MKRVRRTIVVCVALIASAACNQRTPLGPNASVSEATKTLARPLSIQTGNGAPSGAHYNLNIIGVPRDKTADMTGDNGHRIFVPLWGIPKPILALGPDRAVL